MGCTVLRESLRHCQISGERGRESGLPTRSLDRNENSRENPKQLFFCGRIFHRVFRCVFHRTFRRTFRRTSSPHFSPHLSPCLSLQLVAPGNFHSCHNKASMSNEVAQYRKTPRNMPSWRRGQTCLKHTTCHIHCAWQPSWNRRVTLNALHPTKSSSKNHNPQKN